MRTQEPCQLEENTRKFPCDTLIYKEIIREITGQSNNFYLRYQAKFSENKKIIGFEALLRWKCEKYGEIIPEKLIGVAENSNIINMLDFWVIRNVLKQKKKWESIGVNLPISINTTASIYDENNYSIIKKIISDFNINYSQIEFEITERIPLKDISKTIKVMNFLTEKNIKIILDDCGIKEHIDLNHLRLLPISGIKLDKSFAFEMKSPEYTIEHAKDIFGNSIAIFAEGIEKIEEMNFMKKFGIEMFQGNFLGKPMRSETINILLR
ncbi:MAG: EAL domain-containing protein [Nanoarchaeota archaeon]|nr:EAL domain-containing protein [Nanoarchaeota archaeon]